MCLTSEWYRSKKGLQLANLIAVDSNIIKPATMSDTAVFVSLGDDGGHAQALLRAYQSIGGAKGIVMRETGVEPLDLEKMGQRCPEIEDMMDVLFDIHDLEDEELLKTKNQLDDLNLTAIENLNENIEAEAENGAALVIASKDIPRKDLWNQEVEFKPYFLYYAITALTCLERNGTMVIKIYDTHTAFTRSLIYILSCHFNSMCIVKPYSINNFSSERFLVCHSLIHKDKRSNAIIDKLKEIYNIMKPLHLQKSGDLDTLLPEVKNENGDTIPVGKFKTIILSYIFSKNKLHL